VVKEFTDPRIRLVRHEHNRGSEAAKNTGLDNIRGEWFTFVDSDDEIVPEAIDSMLKIPLAQDPLVTKVECNALDVDTGSLSGKGLSGDQYLDPVTAECSTSGDFWGIIRSDLLQGDRFNVSLKGLQSVLWVKVRKRSREYYLHRPLLLVHKGGADRLSVARQDVKTVADFFHHAIGEEEWLEVYRKCHAADYQGFCFRGILFCLAANDRLVAAEYRKRFREVSRGGKRGVAVNVLFATAPFGSRVAIAAARKARQLKQQP